MIVIINQERNDRIQAKLIIQSQMIGISSCSSKSNLPINIDLSQCKYYRSGSDHILYTFSDLNQNLRNKVLIFQKDTASQEQTNKLHEHADSILSQAYMQAILKLEQFQGVLLISQQVVINKQGQGWWAGLQQMYREQTGKQVRLKNRKTNKFQISDNILSEQDWDIFVEFKVKTPLPDVYSTSMVRDVCSQMQLAQGSVAGILRGGSLVEKSRWFKKGIKEHKQKNNENPFVIFGLQGTEEIPNYTGTKLYKDYPIGSEQTINRYIHENLMKEGILAHIFQMQCLYTQSVPHLTEDIKCQSIACCLDQWIKSTVPSYESSRRQVIDWLRDHPCIMDPALQQHQLLTIYKYLISLTWRDISIVFRGKSKRTQDRLTLLEHKFNIIDYELKPLSKVEQNRQKDRDYLEAYLKTKA